MVKFLPQKSDTRAAFVDFEHIEDAKEAHNNVVHMGGVKLRTDYNRRAGGSSRENVARDSGRVDDRYGGGVRDNRERCCLVL